MPPPPAFHASPLEDGTHGPEVPRDAAFLRGYSSGGQVLRDSLERLASITHDHDVGEDLLLGFARYQRHTVVGKVESVRHLSGPFTVGTLAADRFQCPLQARLSRPHSYGWKRYGRCLPDRSEPLQGGGHRFKSCIAQSRAG